MLQNIELFLKKCMIPNFQKIYDSLIWFKICSKYKRYWYDKLSSWYIIKFMSKNGITCNILKNYVENRDLILDSFSNDRKEVKEMSFNYFEWRF